MDIMTDTVPVTGNLVEFTLNVPNGLQRYFVLEAMNVSGNVLYRGGAYADLDGTPITIEISLIGIPTVVQLGPTPFVAQTNAYIYLHALVLDGNGIPVPNTPVIFTNLSFIGVLSSTVANTNSFGIATVTLFSTTPGFSTVQAEVNTGTGQVGDRKTVYFTTNAVLAVTMSMDVESVPGNGIYNETSDFTLFSPPPDPDDTVVVLATVRNADGVRVSGESILWSSDLTGDNVTFLAGTEIITDINGEARAIVRVTPESIRNTEAHLNIMAFAGNGAANMVTLFLQPVTVSTVTVSANPVVIEPSGTSTITAAVTLSTGGPAPDGTVVSFTTTCGSITTFAQTTGAAEATFTAPSTEGTCTITATAGGASDSVDVLVIRALTVIPTTQTISNPAVNDSGTYTIIGGTAPYQAFSDKPALVTVAVAGSVVTATVASVPTDDTTVTITIHDSIGDSVLALLILDI